jgi:tetratricopeptide (TPR) repeat protein
VSRARSLAAALLAVAGGAGLAAPRRCVAAGADRRVQVGDPVQDVELRTVDGGAGHLLQRGAAASVFVFFRLEHERSADTLRELAQCEKEFARRPVHWVGVVSDAWPPAAVRALVAETGVRMPVLVDAGDALYGKLGIRLHPVVGIVDAAGRLAAFEPFREINYCDRIRVRIRLLLGEATPADVAQVDAPAATPLPHSDVGLSRRHVAFARKLHELGQDERALAEVQKALGLAPSAAAWALRGQILAERRSCREATQAFDAALRIEPGNAAALEFRKRGCPR